MTSIRVTCNIIKSNFPTLSPACYVYELTHVGTHIICVVYVISTVLLANTALSSGNKGGSLKMKQSIT